MAREIDEQGHASLDTRGVSPEIPADHPPAVKHRDTPPNTVSRAAASTGLEAWWSLERVTDAKG